MGKWMAENGLGMNPPFLQRNILRPPRRHRQKMPECECCSVRLVDVSLAGTTLVDADGKMLRCEARGYIRTVNGVLPVDIAVNDPIILFSCFDELFLYFFVEDAGKARMFHMTLFGCKNWDEKTHRAHEIGLFGKSGFVERGDECIEVRCRIENLRPQNAYHYRFTENRPHPKRMFRVSFLGNMCDVEKYQCVLCLKSWPGLGDLVNHTNICHYHYSCECRDQVLHIVPSNTEHAKDPQTTNDKFVDTEDAPIDAKRVKIPDISLEHNDQFAREGNTLLMTKKAAIPMLYRLKNYHPLIERESDALDHLEALSDHSTVRLGVLDSHDELAVVREWNRLQIIGDDPRGNLGRMIHRFGLTLEIIRLMEILYKNGVLDSREILSAVIQ